MTVLNQIHSQIFSNNEEGSILAIALFSLLLLSVLGTFALNTADYEINIAANQQRWEVNFNTSEGGAVIEGSNIGYAGVNGNFLWYQIADPELLNLPLTPSTLSTFDPSQADAEEANDDLATGFNIATFDPLSMDTWPRQNLTADVSDNIYDYAYLVTYLFPDTPPKGYSAETHASYKFRINGRRQVVIEMGGQKVGVKNPL